MEYNPPSFTEIKQNKIISVSRNTSNYSALYNSLSSAAHAYLHAEDVDNASLGFRSADSIQPDDATAGFDRWLTVTNINQLNDKLANIATRYESALVNKIITADDAFNFITEYLYETCAIRTCTYKYYKTIDDTKYTTWTGVGLYFRYRSSQSEPQKAYKHKIEYYKLSPSQSHVPQKWIDELTPLPYKSTLVNPVRHFVLYGYDSSTGNTIAYNSGFAPTIGTDVIFPKGIRLYYTGTDNSSSTYDFISVSEHSSNIHDISSKYVDTLDTYRQKVSPYAQSSGIIRGQIITASNCNTFIQKLLRYNASKQKIYDFGARNDIETEPARWHTHTEYLGTWESSESARKPFATRAAELKAEYGSRISNIQMTSEHYAGYKDHFYIVYDLLESSGKKKLVAKFPELVITDKY